MLVAAVGYAYLFFIVFLLLGTVGFVIWLMRNARGADWLILIYLWIPLVLAGLVLRSMWISVPAPDGKELRREEALQLFDLIAEVRTALDAPAVHRVLLSDQFNARVVQVARFGMFGWSTTYLVVGLPLLKSIGADEFRAVIAHEFGHLSAKHSKFSRWIYHLRESWIQVLKRFELARDHAAFVFHRFMRWYGPYFDAYSFVLARAREYEADRCAVEMAGKTVAARALVDMEGKVRALQEELWPRFYQSARDQAEGPENPFTLMLCELEKPIARQRVEKWLRQSLRVETGYNDTHPALSERLERIGFAREVQASASFMHLLELENDSQKQSAADRYLSKVPAEVIDTYNRLWREQIALTWKHTHESVQEARRLLAALNEAGGSRPLTIDEQWERAKCTTEIEGSGASLPIVREIIQQDPNHVGANFAMGAILLEQEDPAGVDYLEKAMQADSWLSVDATNLIYSFFQGQGRQPEADIYQARAQAWYERLQRLYQQALHVTTHDRFKPHCLDDFALTRLRERLTKIRSVRTAYLVRKILDETEWVYVLVVGGVKTLDPVMNELAHEINPGKLMVFVSLDTKPFLTNPITRVPNAQVFIRDEDVAME